MSLKQCRCKGHWKTRRSRWARIASPTDVPLVKCLSCNAKWHSYAAHVATLPMHKERRHQKLHEHEVLVLIEEGRIHVDQLSGRIWKQQRRAERWQSVFCLLSARPDRQNGYLFVDVWHSGCRGRIAVHRVVMLDKLRSLIPATCEVDHRDTNIRHNWGDNLRLLPKRVNRDTRSADRKEKYAAAEHQVA